MLLEVVVQPIFLLHLPLYLFEHVFVLLVDLGRLLLALVAGRLEALSEARVDLGLEAAEAAVFVTGHVLGRAVLLDLGLFVYFHYARCWVGVLF